MPYCACKMRKVHFAELMKKVHNKLQTWKGKMLSFGGNAVLINNVLNNVLSRIPIYLLSAVNPPKLLFMIYIELLQGSYGI